MLGGDQVGGGGEMAMSPGGGGEEQPQSPAPGGRGLMSDSESGKPAPPAGGKVMLAEVAEGAKLAAPTGEGQSGMSTLESGESSGSGTGGGVTSTSGPEQGPCSSASGGGGGEGLAPPTQAGGGFKIPTLEVISKISRISIQGTSAGGIATTTTSPPQPKARLPPQKFENKEKVLCFHGPLLYEAKLLKSEFRKSKREWVYMVHYNGWNKSWDTWVYEHRILKHCEENLKLQKDLKLENDEVREAAAAPKAKVTAKASRSKKKSVVASDAGAGDGASSSSKALEPEPGSSGGGRKTADEHVEPESLFKLKQEVEISIPKKLKQLLVDDWNAVVKRKRLATLPARVTIEGIFEEYLKGKAGDLNSVQLCDGLRSYFNKMIGAQLLYPLEQAQHEELLNRNENKQMTEYYGMAHLMRLFTKLGGCLTFTDLDPEGVRVLQAVIADFFKFIMGKYDAYFSTKDYRAM